MKKCVFTIIIFVILVMSGCSVSETTQVEQDEQMMTELTAVRDAMEDSDAKDVVEKLLNSPTVITRDYINVKDKRDMADVYNTEVAPYQKFSWKPELMLDYREYRRYFSTYLEQGVAGAVRIHYLTVISEIMEDGILKQPLHAFAYHRVLEKLPTISTNNQPVFDNRFFEVGAYQSDGLDIESLGSLSVSEREQRD